jgi:UDP-N-acetylmuramyl-tripeptide synthetase
LAKMPLMTFEELMHMVSAQDPGRVNICFDSRRVKQGDIFVALKGSNVDGHRFISDAVNRGARFIVSQQKCCCSVCNVVVPDSSVALGLLSQAAYSNPSAKLVNLAVTGTNGKTTVGFLVQAVFNYLGQKCGLVGTVCYDTGQTCAQSSLTTPAASDIAKLAYEMVHSGVYCMMIEASSHALSQRRLAGINFAAAAFTNLSGDHLDYHRSMEEYLATITQFGRDIVLNSDEDVCAFHETLSEDCENKPAHIQFFFRGGSGSPINCAYFIEYPVGINLNGNVIEIDSRNEYLAVLNASPTAYDDITLVYPVSAFKLNDDEIIFGADAEICEFLNNCQ